jgi:two-component system, cell cycle response regulator
VNEEPSTDVDLDATLGGDGDPVGGAALITLKGPEAGRIDLVSGFGCVLGRGDDVDVPFEDLSISRRHARFERSDGGYRVRDLDSANGTFVDGRRVHSIVDLPDSCNIRIGRATELHYTVVDEIGIEAIEQLQRSLLIDPLTGVGRRLYLERRLNEALAYGQRHGTTIGLMMLDVDSFKQINDTHGHPAGDLALRRFADQLVEVVRTEDSVFRYGGDEFSILVRGQSRDGLLAMAERVRQAVEAMNLRYEGHRIPVTTSIGVAGFQPGWTTITRTVETDTSIALCPEGAYLVELADHALMMAKQQGKNRYIALWEGPEPDAEDS